MTIEVLDTWTITLSGPGDTATHDLPVGVTLQEGDVIATLGAESFSYPSGSYGWIDDDAQSWLVGDLATGCSSTTGGLSGGNQEGRTASVHVGAVYSGAAGNSSIDYEYLGDAVGAMTRSYILIRGAQSSSMAQHGCDTEYRALSGVLATPDPCDVTESSQAYDGPSGIAGSILLSAGIAEPGTCDGGVVALSGGPGGTPVTSGASYRTEYKLNSGAHTAYSDDAGSPGGGHNGASLWLAPQAAPDPDEDVLYDPSDAGAVAHVVISDNVLEDYGIDTGIVLENVFYGVISGNYGEYSTLKATFCSYLQVTGNHIAFASGMLLDAVWYSSIEGNHVVALNGDAPFTLSGNSVRNTIIANKANAWRDYQLLDHAVILGASTAENSIAFNDFRILYDVSQADDAGTDNIILLNLPETTVEAGAIALDDLTDVNAAGATDGQALVYDDGTGTWIPSTISAGAVASLDDIGDVDVATAADGQLLAWDATGGNWVAIDPPAGSGDMTKLVYDSDDNGVVDAAESVPWSGVTDKPTTFPPEAHSHTVSDISDFPTIPDAISDLSDVDTTGVADGQFLQWDETGGNWVPGTPSGAGDMLISVYDTNGNNVVDAAESVPWAGITDAPTEFPPEAHTHALADLSDVDLTGVTDGYTLIYESGGWVVAEPTATPGETPTIDIGQLHEHAYSEDHSGECNGSLLTVILANEFSPGTVQVWLNGLRQRPGRDYDEVSYDSIVFSTAPLAGDDLLIDYEVA